MKVNEQRLRIKAVYKNLNDPNRSSLQNINSQSSSRGEKFQFMKSFGEDPSHRANTTNNDQSGIYKTLNHYRNDLNSASMLGGSFINREAMSTRGGLSKGKSNLE